MGWLGLKVAKEFGQKLPAFASQADAQESLFKERDDRLLRMAQLAARSQVFHADFTPQTLKALEQWYFELWNSNSFDSLDIRREDFERCMASYFCEVAVRNCPGVQWVVQEYAFEAGKFEIGVRRGLLTLMTARFSDWYKEPGNKKHQKLRREFEKYFSR